MSWYVWHQGYGAANKYTLLNNTNAVNSGTYVFNNTLPTASVITDYAGNSNHHNEGRAMIYYSWHDVPGLQKFGSFTGNNNADGVFVELGFKPAILWIKNTSDIGGIQNYASWLILDTERDTHNVSNSTLWANQTAVEGKRGDGSTAVGSNCDVDILSNGFKIRTASVETNGSGNAMIYCAWAEAPTVNLFGGGANAR